MTRNMDAFLNSAFVRFDFTNFKLACYGAHYAAQSVLDFSSINGNQNAAAAISQMQTFLNQWIVDASTAGWKLWNRGYERWKMIWSAYWTNFGFTIIMLIIFCIILCALCQFSRDTNYKFSTTVLKVLLCILGFCITVYVAMVMLLLAGSGALQTFCTVLAQVNLNNTAILDQIPLQFTRYNKLIIKECTAGLDGDLLKYAYMY